MKTPELPENAPFDEEQRAWLNGYIAALLTGVGDEPAAESGSEAAGADADNGAPAEAWHDPALSLDERMQLAESRPLADRLMAATANEDCGACGYDCRTYADALAAGTETDTTLCAPGGNETRKQLKAILKGEA
jgi:sulfite reductase (NADPH) flavoprotein alpha-component